MNPFDSSRRTLRLACCALPLGYGPAAKLVTLAAELRAHGMELVFVGRGLALELAARHSDLFSDVVAAEQPSETTAKLLNSAAGVLSLMDREFSAQAAALGRPLFIVDSLMWMRNALPPSWRGARTLFAQNFCGLHASPHLMDPRVRVVGPLVAAAPVRENTPATRLLIQLGGCESTGGDDAYIRFIVENLLASSLPQALAPRTTLIAGKECIRRLRYRYRGSNLHFLSLSHAAALSELDQAALVLTAPGLTSTLEAFQRGVPACFLPPQNYSQWCILRALRANGLAPAALHWEDLPAQEPLAERLPEAARNPQVAAALARHTADSRAAVELQRCLTEMAGIDLDSLAGRQRRFFDSLGTPAASTVASQLAAALDSE